MIKRLLLIFMIVLGLMVMPVGSDHVQAASTIKVTMKITGLKNKVMKKGTITIKKNKTVYDALITFAKKKKIKVKKRGYFPSTYYITSIGGLAEKQHGPLSGWMYKVNGKAPNKGAGSYKLTKKSTVLWYYVNATK
ncbi:MAG: DUF4430 domain-containing protein [bacterium]